MNKLTESLTDDFLNILGIYKEDNKYKIYYEGFISKSMSCYENIVKYYKIQKDTEYLPSILHVSTPSTIKIYSDNNIIFFIELNGIEICIGIEDIDYIFKKELRVFKLDSILN